MVEIIVGVLILSLGGLGYFTIWRLTDGTHDRVNEYSKDFVEMRVQLDSMEGTINHWKQKFLDLETELKLRKHDSSRLIEWIDKRDKQLAQLEVEFIKGQRITERESKIIELGEKLKLITKR